MWTFARVHFDMYKPLGETWNRSQEPKVHIDLLGREILAQRMTSSFHADIPTADMIEVERTIIGQVFSGRVEDVGFVDLTDRLKSEGLLDEINAPSFSPWTTRGHIFGLPHDVHPVLLCYRADLVEEAGIDMSKIETWDDFARVMRPIVKDLDGDGRPDRYALNLWFTSIDQIEALILQAGGGFFDENDQPIVDSASNARVISTVVAWTLGPDRISADAPEFNASGNQLKLQGYVVASLVPDWLTGVWKTDMPQLGGKLKLMPLPAWDRGGRRTTVQGGTMLGICKTCKDFDGAWKFAKNLYTSPELAQKLYETNGIVSPVKKLWNSPFYDRPDPYFSGQPAGRLYLQQAPNVPRRTGSPLNTFAQQRVQDAIAALRDYAESHRIYDAKQLEPEARRQLKIAENLVRRQMDRNVFLTRAASSAAATGGANQ
jgi:arabinosaccharide transport system substrate-binding protein